MSWLQIEPQFQRLFTDLRLTTTEAIVSHFTRDKELRGEVFVTPATLENEGITHSVFFKVYRYARPSWRFWNRASKARREFENYRTLESLGVPVAQRVACGEDRDVLGRLRSAFIITATVPGARTLIEFATSTRTGPARHGLLTELARAVSAMHAANFFYHDLVWRNLLVNGDHHLVLIDCPRGGFARFGRGRHRLRDLASLDKLASKHCRRPERLRFVLNYLSKPRVDDEARRLIRACLDYRRTRWPEDWAGK